jgi:hypothetical protein
MAPKEGFRAGKFKEALWFVFASRSRYFGPVS